MYIIVLVTTNFNFIQSVIEHFVYFIFDRT